MSWLKQRREELGLSQDELAARLQTEGVEVTRATISNWETGRHKPPLMEEEFRIALSRSIRLSVKEILRQSGYEVVVEHSHAGEKAAYLVDQLSPDRQNLAIRLLEQLGD